MLLYICLYSYGIYVSTRGHSTLRRKPFWEALCVCAIIINHVILLHPLEFLSACFIKLIDLHPCRGWRIRRARRRNDWTCWVTNASFGIKVSTRSCKWSFCPICFDKTASCCPVISVPETRVYSHWLVFWVRNVDWLQVLELSNRCAIDIESENVFKQKC